MSNATLTRDDMARIREFASAGYGRKAISDYIGVSEYAVKQVLEGKQPNVTGQLSTRERGELINRAFGPPRGR